jgi:hypothetical protein
MRWSQNLGIIDLGDSSTASSGTITLRFHLHSDSVGKPRDLDLFLNGAPIATHSFPTDQKVEWVIPVELPAGPRVLSLSARPGSRWGHDSKGDRRQLSLAFESCRFVQITPSP